MKKIVYILLLSLALSGCSKITQDDQNLVVGMECAYPPFNWIQNNETDEAVAVEGGMYCDGYDVQIAKLIAKEMNRDLVIHVNPVFDALLTDVQNGTIDLIIAGMTDTEERRQSVDFTNIYYYTDIVMMVRKDSHLINATSIQDFKGERVAAQTGTMHDALIDQIEGVNHMMPLENFPALTTNLVNNAIDAFVSENVVAEAIAQTNPTLTYIKLKDNFELEEDMSVSIGLKKGREDFKNEINEILASISDEARDELMNDAISRQP